jgi:hypothetical protein
MRAPRWLRRAPRSLVVTGILTLAVVAAVPAAVAVAAPWSTGTISANFIGDWGDGGQIDLDGSLVVNGYLYQGTSVEVEVASGSARVDIGPLTYGGCWAIDHWEEHRLYRADDPGDDLVVIHFSNETSAQVPVGGDSGDVWIGVVYAQAPGCSIA